MHVALVHLRHAETGGTERFLGSLARHLAESGHLATIVCRRRAEAPHPDVRFVLLRGPAFGKAHRMWRFARDVEQHVSGASYDVVLGLGKTFSHDVIRSGGGAHASYLAAAHCHARRGWESALGLDALKNRVAIELERRAFAPGAARRVIVNASRVGADLARRHGLPAERIEVVYNGIDVARFHPRRRAAEGAERRRAWGVARGEPLLLFLGRGFGRKGLDRLLCALPRVLAVRPDARLVVVGRDEGGSRYAALAEELGVAHRVRFEPETRTPEACLAAADLYVLPTRFDPFPVTTLEALACGTPVITTDVTGTSELMRAGVEGALVSADGPPEELASALLDWLEPERLAAGRPAARALAERHPIGRMLAETTAILAAVLAEKRAERAVRSAPDREIGRAARSAT